MIDTIDTIDTAEFKIAPESGVDGPRGIDTIDTGDRHLCAEMVPDLPPARLSDPRS